MRIGDRVLLIIAMLLCIAASAYLFAIVWGFLPLQSLVQALYNIMDAWYYRVGVTALLLLMALGFVRLLFVRTNPGQVLLREGIAINQSGDVRISVDALRQMCEEVAKTDPRVELVACTVNTSAQGLLIGIKAHCRAEQYIPGIVEALQQKIAQMLRESCGITTAKVQVLIEKAEVVKSPVPSAAVNAREPVVLQQENAADLADAKAGEEITHG